MITGTTVVRRTLGRQLKTLRDRARLTVEQVTAADGGSETKIWRIEKGKVAVKVETALHLASLYNASEEERQILVALARATGQQGWWQEYADAIPDWFHLYVGLEAEAASILAWDAQLIPGPLQIADYARAVFRASVDAPTPETVERQVKVRMARQKRLLERTPAPRISVVLEEGALARQVGGPDVWDAQLRHLRRLDELPEVSIRWLRSTAGEHPAMAGAFRVLSFDDGDDPDVVYLEADAGAQYLEKSTQIARYRRAFEMITKKSTPIGEYQWQGPHG